jgi:hypothetical protein
MKLHNEEYHHFYVRLHLLSSGRIRVAGPVVTHMENAKCIQNFVRKTRRRTIGDRGLEPNGRTKIGK